MFRNGRTFALVWFLIFAPAILVTILTGVTR